MVHFNNWEFQIKFFYFKFQIILKLNFILVKIINLQYYILIFILEIKSKINAIYIIVLIIIYTNL